MVGAMRWFLDDDEKWHSWFAWYPIHIGDNQMVWLERLECRKVYGVYDIWWYYRFPPNPSKTGDSE